MFSCISLCWSLRKTFLSLLAILWNSAFKWVHFSVSLLPFASLLYSVICKAYSDNHFAFLHFFPPLGMVMITASSTVSWTSVHSSLGTLLDLIPWIYLSLPVYNLKEFDSGQTTEWSSGFPYSFQFNSEFGNKEFMIWATVSSQSCFCWLYRAFSIFGCKFHIPGASFVLFSLSYR